MVFINNFNSTKLDLIEGIVKRNFSLASSTWFKVGGNAELFYQPTSFEGLQKFLKAINPKVPLFVIGAGSNSLIRDGGIKGVVIHLGKKFSNIEVEKNFNIKVGAGFNCIKLSRDLAKLGIKGLEFFSGIPGTVGGAIKMNAGAYNFQTSDRLIYINCINRKGNVIKLDAKDYKMGYRKTNFPKDHIFCEALFSCEKGKKENLIKKISELSKQRKNTQPIKDNTGGSTFKNPKNYKAWQLIKSSGCEKLSVGGAHISELHANFIVNDGSASSSDIEELGEEIKKRVKRKFGINLEWEIKIVGNKVVSKEVHYD